MKGIKDLSGRREVKRAKGKGARTAVSWMLDECDDEEEEGLTWRSTVPLLISFVVKPGLDCADRELPLFDVFPTLINTSTFHTVRNTNPLPRRHRDAVPSRCHGDTHLRQSPTQS